MQDASAGTSAPLLSHTPPWLTGIGIFVAFWIAAIIVEKTILFMARKAQVQVDVCYLMARIAKMVLIVIGVITGLGTVGIDVSAMVAGLGLTGFALGFALKDALSNVLAGVLVLIYQPFRVGTRIKVGNYDGTVVRIDLRYTTIESENRKVLIPNSNLFNQPVELLRS